MTELLKDFKSGPLDIYRKKASFDWKKLKVILDTEDIIRYEKELYDIFENHPLFSTQNNSLSSDLDTQRHESFLQCMVLKYAPQLSLATQIENFRRPAASVRILTQACASSYIKCSVSDSLFKASIMNMGTQRHQHFIEDCEEGKILGCYVLTEIGHGSNARGMRTTATYDKTKKVFVLHSPDFEAAKCWAGGLGQTATHGTIYAQLILDGVRYGLHAFVVPLRHPQTLLPYPGVIVGDMGEKLGLNGVDNGFVQFDNYEIPRENLLNKVADVSEDGRYVTAIKDPNKRHGAALGSLSGGRVNITTMVEAYGIKALTIAIRYAAVRKQFGPEANVEVPILEYQSHQHRLIPHLAAAYVIRVFNNFFGVVFYEFSVNRALGREDKNGPELGMEIHALSSACKPVAGWSMRDAIQECRECCAGHGYLKVSNLGDTRNDHDANLTYEGENHILIQQTANYLLKFWPLVLSRKSISSPLESLNFLTNGLEILSSKFIARTVEQMCQPNRIIEAYQWLVCYLLKRTYEKLEAQMNAGKSSFWAKNDAQVYYAKTLAIVYIQHYFLNRMLAFISTVNDVPLKRVLHKLFALYGVYTLEKHMQYLYQGGYAVGPEPATIIQDTILKLCSELKDDAVSLIDAVAPPDFILKSALGASDGQVYKHLRDAFMLSSYGMKRPQWWQEIVSVKDFKNKL